VKRQYLLLSGLTLLGCRLVEIVGHRVAGTRPELVCAKPTVTRAVSFELGIGDVTLGHEVGALGSPAPR
jgi:hypothetical protein